MRTGVVLAGIAGLGLAMWLLASYGIDRVLDLLGRAGWGGIAAVIAFHVVQIAFSAAAWREIAGPMERRPTFARYGVLRWIREGVNNLLPVAQIGGEFAVARLMQRRGVPLAPAIASTIADVTMEMITQIPFTLFGLAILSYREDAGDLSRSVIGIVLIAALVAAAFLGSQWLGLALVLEKGLMRLGRALHWAGTAEVKGLHQALLACYRRPRRMMLAMTWHSISWLLGGLEVQLAFHFLGHDIGLGAGMAIESLGQALKAAGFAVPGALGVQEGGYIIVCQAFALSPESAIALSLMKRLREVVLGVPALVTWRIVSRRSCSVVSHPSVEASP